MKATVVDTERPKVVGVIEDADARDPGVRDVVNAVGDNVEWAAVEKHVVIVLVVVVRIVSYDTRGQGGMAQVAEVRANVVRLLSDLHGDDLLLFLFGHGVSL